MQAPNTPTCQRLRRSKRWIVWGGLDFGKQIQWCGPYRTRDEADRGRISVIRAIKLLRGETDGKAR